jgi:serine/threonine protein kinase
MRATNDKLGERYIIVVARELSKALKGLHDAGIMHRDIKGKLGRIVFSTHHPRVFDSYLCVDDWCVFGFDAKADFWFTF